MLAELEAYAGSILHESGVPVVSQTEIRFD
ncbi:hypothetical protein J2Z75_003785 [Rhizobium herbae]|uniref:Uncharacterized protein n=1 Tax=Rhizobium herbae TaxID=508661 RepID=A0ABS4EQN9_9HYPH|nr:hypothetical protein [Rhizobium herbae]